MDSTTGTGTQDVQHLADQIEAGVRKGLYTWRDIQEAVVFKTRETAERTGHYVHENPWGVVGIAAALGLVLGLLMAPSSQE